MELHLDPDEAELLREILTVYLSDLRMEIADTDQSTFKEGLKVQREQVRALIERLEQLTAAPA